MQWHKAGVYSLVRTKTANLRVWWSGGILPPSLFVGDKVNFIGRLITEDEGKRIRISDAIPFQGKYWQIVEPLYRYLFHFTDDPREWCPPEIVDKQRWRTYEDDDVSDH